MENPSYIKGRINYESGTVERLKDGFRVVFEDDIPWDVRVPEAPIEIDEHFVELSSGCEDAHAATLTDAIKSCEIDLVRAYFGMTGLVVQACCERFGSESCALSNSTPDEFAADIERLL